MREPHSQALRRRTSELLELMKDVAGIELKLSREHFGLRAQRQEGSRLGAMLS